MVIYLNPNLADGLLYVAVCYILYIVYTRVVSSRNRLPYPPGPPGLPVIGLTKVPEEPSWITYRDWSEQYGSDVLCLKLWGNPIIIINSFQASVDLLEKRSNIYSDRPQEGLTMLKELCGLGWSFGLQPYGQEWRDGRRAFHHDFNINAVRKYRQVHVQEAHLLIRSILATPEKFMVHVQRMTGGEVLRIGYGIDVQQENDPFIATAKHAADALRATFNPGSYLVDLIPLLKYVPEWMPGASFQREARAWRKSITDMRDKPYSILKQKMAEDPAVAPDCAAKFLIEKLVPDAEDPDYMERVIKSVVGTMYLGGADITFSIFWSFFLAIVLNPDVQRKAQAEIDYVCGGRLPDFADFDSLPYIHAIVKESLRWNPVVNLNIPHRLITDDIYNGYYIPEGATVIANIWAIMHNPQDFPNPDAFNPDRFLKQTGPNVHDIALDDSVMDPMDTVFGFGRRICPGRFMAYENLWISIACILAVFDILPSKDASGRRVPPSGEYMYGFTCHPKPFTCEIKPRSAEHEAWIQQTAVTDL